MDMSASEKEKLGDADAGTAVTVSPSVSPVVPKSPSSDASDVTDVIDPQAERKLLRKLDLILWPVFFVIYMMAFLDRINVSNAAIQGMTAELGLGIGNRFNVVLFVRFFNFLLLIISWDWLADHIHDITMIRHITRPTSSSRSPPT